MDLQISSSLKYLKILPNSFDDQATLTTSVILIPGQKREKQIANIDSLFQGEKNDQIEREMKQIDFCIKDNKIWNFKNVSI